MKAVRQKGTFSYPAFMGCRDYWQNEFLTQKIQFRTAHKVRENVITQGAQLSADVMIAEPWQMRENVWLITFY